LRTRLSIAAIAALCTSLATTPLSAQTVEAGGTIAGSCTGSDGSFCDESGLLTGGLFASVWIADLLEVGGRTAWLRRADVRFDRPVSGSIVDRGRFMAQADAIWHFRQGKLLRPFVGLGLGGSRDRRTVTCSTPGCEPLLGLSGLRAGTEHRWHSDQAVIVGVSALPTSRVRVRGGVRYHNPFRDELALSEWFVGAGYRFGR
jgi:opacity protein-like surface antigen